MDESGNARSVERLLQRLTSQFLGMCSLVPLHEMSSVVGSSTSKLRSWPIEKQRKGEEMLPKQIVCYKQSKIV